jgi:hypothetical protein
MYSLLHARGLRSQIEQHRDSPEGAWGPYLGSGYWHAVRAALVALPGLRASLHTYLTVQHPQGVTLATEIAALEALIEEVRMPGMY